MSQRNPEPRQPVPAGADGPDSEDGAGGAGQELSAELSDADLGEVVGGYVFIDFVE